MADNKNDKAENPRYTTPFTHPTRQRGLPTASEFQPGKNGSGPDATWTHVTNESRSNYFTTRRELASLRRVWLRRHIWKTTGKIGGRLHWTQRERLRLGRAHAHASYSERLFRGISPEIEHGPANRFPRLAIKTLIIVAELAVIGAVLRSALRSQPWEGWATSIGVSLGLLAIPSLAGGYAKAKEAEVILREGGVPRLLYNRALKVRRFPAGSKTTRLLALCFAGFILAIGLALGAVVWIEKSLSAGLLVPIVILTTNVGMAVTEYKSASVASEALRDISRQRRRDRRELRRRGRRRSALSVFSKAAARLSLVNLIDSSDEAGRRHASISEAAVAGGLIGMKLDSLPKVGATDIRFAGVEDSQGDDSETDVFDPAKWTADFTLITDKRQPEFELLKQEIEELNAKATYLLEVVDLIGPATPPEPDLVDISAVEGQLA